MNVSYYESAVKLVGHLNSKLVNELYPDQTTWGYAFSLLAALEINKDLQNDEFAKKALDSLVTQDKASSNYSWEFVVYALHRSKKICSDSSLINYSYAEKGTRMVNWTLLRQLNRINHGKDSFRVGPILRAIKHFFTQDTGQILDELKTRSLQYHAFCLFVLAELDQTGYHPLVKEWLISGCRFACSMILKNGTALYIGRGQEQIFGYGSLIFALEYANSKYKLAIESKVDHIWCYLQGFQREDGSFPLVLIPHQLEKPNVSFIKDKPHGWFGYNTLYDYQPFLAYCLARADKFKKGYYD